MNLDRELFEEFFQHEAALPLLRICQVTEPAMTGGRSWRSSLRGSVSKQGRSNLDVALCLRPTGGGLVRHGNDLIYSVIARKDTFPTFGLVRTSYLSFHEAVQEAFRQLGIEARLLRCDEAKQMTHRGRQVAVRDCFKMPIATDVLLGKQKIAGAAQWRRSGAFLHQGSIQIPSRISFEALKGAFVAAFEKKFEVIWKEGEAERGS